MTTRLGLDSNIESVIESVDDVKDDLRHELAKRVGAAMRVMWSDARQYVLDDPNTTGDLLRAVQYDQETGRTELDFTVYTDGNMAAHAAIVEFGSGSRTNIPFEGGNRVPGSWPSTGSAVPVGYPFDAPDIPYNEENPVDTRGYSKFYGFVKYIEEWMRAKPVTPKTGDYFVSAAFIAEAIVQRGNYAHPFLRPAWFDNELQIKRAAKNALKNAVR